MDQELFRTIGTFVGPALAAVIVMIGWRRTHRDALERDAKTQQTAADRDLENWRRTTLSQAIVDLLKLSKDRYDLVRALSENYDPKGNKNKSITIFNEMQNKILQIRICASGTDVEKKAVGLGNLHAVSIGAILGSTNGNIESFEERMKANHLIITMRDFDAIEVHHELLRATQKELRQTVDQPYHLTEEGRQV
ncbi:hypothetical protein BH92_15410 [Rhodococcoides fascians A21d2]|uniref:hypothetical protein n=1 Tax=Rhodococcoides fascians TaxID=1828 RepID=UPI00056D5D6F|nr:hypothetical protein [Rhodococcus fascians]QII01077.1 hypothetical protein BH92_15410 [Rhodococcus fascians A21d2]